MQKHDITIDVEHADVLKRPADVLVLKYAQQLHGVDRLVASMLRADATRMPAVGAYLAVPGRDPLAAGQVLFLGVPAIADFGYREIRAFGERALAGAAEQCPDAQELVMTIHGPGFGLDEIEAFDSQLAGVFDAMDSGRMPGRLRSVVFVEKDERRVRRLRDALRRIVRTSSVPARSPFSAPGMDDRISRHLRSVGYDAPQKDRVFVAMPFADEFEDVFHFGIADPIRRAGLLCERMDQMQFVGDVVAAMTARIAASRLVVAELTGNNPNVYLEVGYAWGREIPTVLLCRDAHEVKFDVQGHRHLRYKSIKDLADQLGDTLAALVGSTSSRKATTWRRGA
ncbi:hypothetical protein M1L60_07245 [Actinoplanes sp. TRM 88003]|uniref:Nucleoside 2-deoxyribosyltransferase n=1 Tax=Paractinoplanes aksuensis TaxID=2939490 RepID=A0ABT1DHV4_9ACTN|nr:hypothetical protein [Actinoplanes aksuensis]MCO8270390.1 hypothetical protein [Actinoplanes aksuensis]